MVFSSRATNLAPGGTGVFVKDLLTGQTTRVAGGTEPSISADGRHVVFQSYASDLVPGDTNDQPDVFLTDRSTGATTRVNVGPGGAEANGASVSPAISADGRYIAFDSGASNLIEGDTNGWADVFRTSRP